MKNIIRKIKKINRDMEVRNLRRTVSGPLDQNTINAYFYSKEKK